MTAHDRMVGGIRCMEVLELLDDWVDGNLSESTRTRVRAHVEACDWCARFGGRYATLVRRLRSEVRTTRADLAERASTDEVLGILDGIPKGRD